jgi:hypothetical protein
MTIILHRIRTGWPRLIGTAFALVMAASLANAQSASFSIVTSPSPNVHGNILNAASALNLTDAWTVGLQNDSQLNDSRTLTEHWNGRKWTVVPSPNPGSPPSCNRQNTGNVLNTVTEIAPANTWAAGFQFSCHTAELKPLIIHWGGRGWTTSPNPALGPNGNSALNGITAPAPNDVYAVGYQPAPNGAVLTLIEHWNGSAWAVVASPNPDSTGNLLNAVSADTASDIWAVGDQNAPNTQVQTLVEHFDGTAWSVVPSPNPASGAFLDQDVLSSVKVFAANDATAVGFALNAVTLAQLTLIEHWDGLSWRVVPSPNQSDAAGAVNTLASVSGFASNDLYAVGSFSDAATNGQPMTLIEHFDGTNWSVISSPTEGLAQLLNGAFAVPNSSTIWAVGAFSFNGFDTESRLLVVPQTLVLKSSNG